MKKFTKKVGTRIFTLTMVATMAGNSFTMVWAAETDGNSSEVVEVTTTENTEIQTTEMDVETESEECGADLDIKSENGEVISQNDTTVVETKEISLSVVEDTEKVKKEVETKTDAKAETVKTEAKTTETETKVKTVEKDTMPVAVVDNKKDEAKEDTKPQEKALTLTYYIALDGKSHIAHATSNFTKLGVGETEEAVIVVSTEKDETNEDKLQEVIAPVVMSVELINNIDSYSKYAKLSDGTILVDEYGVPVKCQWFKEYRTVHEKDGWHVDGYRADYEGRTVGSQKYVIFVDQDNNYLGIQRANADNKIGTMSYTISNTEKFAGWVNESNNDAVSEETSIEGDYIVVKATYNNTDENPQKDSVAPVNPKKDDDTKPSKKDDTNKIKEDKDNKKDNKKKDNKKDDKKKDNKKDNKKKDNKKDDKKKDNKKDDKKNSTKKTTVSKKDNNNGNNGKDTDTKKKNKNDKDDKKKVVVQKAPGTDGTNTPGNNSEKTTKVQKEVGTQKLAVAADEHNCFIHLIIFILTALVGGYNLLRAMMRASEGKDEQYEEMDFAQEVLD